MFLDDDAWLNDGWWEEAKKYIIEKRVGEIWGINWDIDQRRIRYLKSYEKHLIECFQKGVVYMICSIVEKLLRMLKYHHAYIYLKMPIYIYI